MAGGRAALVSSVLVSRFCLQSLGRDGAAAAGPALILITGTRPHIPGINQDGSDPACLQNHVSPTGEPFPGLGQIPPSRCPAETKLTR